MRTVLDIPRNESGLVDKYIGTAYDIVKNVHDNLATVKQVSFYMEDLVAISNSLEALKEIQADLAVLNAIYTNLPFLRTLMSQVDEYMTVLNAYKTLLSSAEGATHIGTANGKTVQEVINTVNQKLDDLEKHWADNQKLLANLGSNAMYFAESKVVATTLAADLPAGSIILVPADSTLANASVLYLVAPNKSVSVLLNLKQLNLDLADATKGSSLIGHTNADATTTTVKALLNKLTADLTTASTTLGTLGTTVGQHTTAIGGLTSTQSTQGQTLATQQQTLATIQQKQSTQDTALAAVKTTADAAATKTALAAVKTTADAAATKTSVDTLSTTLNGVKTKADNAATATALAAVKTTADAAAPASTVTALSTKVAGVKTTADAAATKVALDALTARVAALEAKNP